MFIESKHFGIRTKPITNREYLIFLVWNIEVYGGSYPEYVNTLLPVGTETINFRYEYFPEIFNKSTDLFTNYIMNPKYIDYPVTGLSNQQVQIILKWMNDRYNEDLLIRTGFYYFNMDQMDEDNFVIESLLVDQYEGSIKEFIKSFDNHALKPTFRLPLEKEIVSLKEKKIPTAVFTSYKFSKKDFLWRWNKAFIRVSKNQIEIRRYDDSYAVIENNQMIQLSNGKPVLLEKKSKTLKNTKIIEVTPNDISYNYYNKNYPYTVKDSLGHMNFVFVGMDKDNRPVAADKVISDNEIIENGIYWIAYNRLLEDEYLPK